MHIIFDNRIDAGRQLAQRLLDLRERSDVIVLGLPRGGVPVAAEVAKAIKPSHGLHAMNVRKIGTPGREELAMGAIASGDQVVLDQQIISQFNVTEEQIQETIARERDLLEYRERLYRGEQPLPNLTGKTVLIIDDGLATGSTMLVAIRTVKQQRPLRILVGVPVGSPDTVAMINREVARVECVSTPSDFRAVGQWYRDFRATTDEDVLAALNR